jgi:hypothetical protein
MPFAATHLDQRLTVKVAFDDRARILEVFSEHCAHRLLILVPHSVIHQFRTKTAIHDETAVTLPYQIDVSGRAASCLVARFEHDILKDRYAANRVQHFLVNLRLCNRPQCTLDRHLINHQFFHGARPDCQRDSR